MADTVETAIYKLAVDGEEDVDALAASLGRLGAAEERAAASGAKVTVTHETMSRATRTTSDSYGKMMSRLDPMVRAEQQHAAALAQISRLQEEGAISAQQATIAVTAATSRYADAIQRVKGTRAEGVFLGAAEGAKLSAFQTQNLAFQIQDVATMLASGQNPFVTIMQQGLQIVGIFGEGSRSVVGAMKAVGASIVSFLSNPLTLVVIGLAVAAGAVKLFFDLISGGGKDAEETLKRQEDLVKRIKDRFGETDAAAKKYQATLDSLRFSERGLGEDLAKTLKAQLAPLKGLAGGFGLAQSLGFASSGRQFDDDQMEAMFRATVKFTDTIRAGKADVLAFNEEIAALANSDPADKALQKFARRLAEATKEASATAVAIRDLNRTMLANMDVAGRLAASSDLAQQDMANYAKFANETAVTIERLNEAHEAELAAIGAKSPAQKAAAAAEAERISLIGQEVTQEEKAVRIAQAGAMARAEAEYDLSEATRDRLMAMDESVAAAQLEIDVLGKSTGEAARLTTQFQLLQAAKQAAIDSGTIVSDEEIAAINETAAAVGELNQKLAEQQKLRDLAFERSQTFRSDAGQEVASSLRDVYGDEWQKHADDAIAKQIRINALTEQVRDGFDSVKDAAVGAGISMVTAFVNGEASAQDMADTLHSLRDSLAEGALRDLISGNLVSAGIKGIGAAVAHIFGNRAQERADEQARREEARLKREEKLQDRKEDLARKEDLRQSLREQRAGYSDRAYFAGLDTSTIEGQLAQFDREAQRERADLAASINNAARRNRQLAALDEALAAERLALLEDYNAQVLAEQQAAQEALVAGAQDDLRQAYEAQRDVLTQVRDRALAFVASMKDLRDSLRLGSSSPLSPTDRLAEAQRQFEESAGLAASGDQAAMDKVAGAAQAYLTEARGFFASAPEYAAIFSQVDSVLAQLGVSATDQASVADQQLAALDAQVGALITINESVLSVADAINNYLSVTGQTKAAEADAALVAAGAPSGVTAVSGGYMYNGQFYTEAEGKAALHAAGVPGYAAGGWVTGGVPGRDSVPAMLTPGEYVLNTRQAQAFASGGANDNGRYFDLQNRVLMTGFSAMVAALREENAALRASIKDLQRTISVESSRPPRPGVKAA